MANPNDTQQKILGFRKTVEGWHFGEGVAPNSIIIDMALKINNAMSDVGFQETDAFLGSAGEIQVNAYSDRVYIETIIDIDSSIEFIYERDNIEQINQSNLSLSNAIAKIKFWGQTWDILESFIKTTMTTQSAGLQASSFQFHRQMAAFQLLIPNVSRQADEGDVGISESTTPTMQVPIPYFSNSTLQYSRMGAST